MTNTKAHEDFSCYVDLNMEKLNDSKPEGHSTNDQHLEDKMSKDKVLQEKADSRNIIKNNFEGFGFSDALLETIKLKGYKEPSPIQKAAIPELMLGRDLVGQAQTGTGKTAAFALPLIERLKKEHKHPQILVLTPTRELAMQVADSFRAYAAGHPHLKILAVYGGADFRSQINTLKRGVDVIVGTPGRVMDHMRQKTLTTADLECLVLDEADEMLRMGFIDDVEWILDQLPNKRQLILFSATMPSEIRRLSKRYLNEPAEITIKSCAQEARLIKQSFITVKNTHKIEAVKRVLEARSGQGVIIFVRTKMITLSVAEALEASGHEVAVLNGDVPQTQRERTVERLRNGNINILVATDVAARGLDVERVGLVVNYDMPFDSEAYIHRIGRTGRAGRNGEAILFVNPRERHFLSNLERAVGQPIEQMAIPSNNDINKSRIERLHAQLLKAAKEGRDHDEETTLFNELIKNVGEELKIDSDKIALAAISLAVGPNPLLVHEDEDWLKQFAQGNRSDERREKRNHSRRRTDRDTHHSDNNMESFRVAVGHRDRVKPGNLVGAIANETGLKGRMIGRIQIFQSHSLIDLPKGMPEDIFKDLKKLRVMNRELQISRNSQQ
ncbi:DEAD/DEAH box helicase [Prochlorococcus sp. MIT 1307]|uniref:DEAD/DEAH box helicase n=1 Tax=Prochlorococcus sp. MIT 1307 TaxID=3096219 RepID=UPI002A74970E|nr:DEAD/DEAH box helicase [Prochlorococcus sp. MIT 1307]